MKTGFSIFFCRSASIESGESPIVSIDKINDIIHRVSRHIIRRGVGVRHETAAEVHQPFVNSMLSIRNDVVLKTTNPEALNEWSRVERMNRQGERFKKRVIPIFAMLRKKVARLLGFVHGGDAVAQEPPSPALVYCGLFHFIHNVRALAPASEGK